MQATARATSTRKGSRWVAIAGALLGCIVWLWMRSLRVRVIDEASGAGVDDAPWVLAFFHGTQVPLLAWRRRRATRVMVSWSRDGELQARVLATQGMVVVRGSTSRGGARALVALVKSVRADRRSDVAFAVDGPRGPIGAAKEGASTCARNIDGVLVPMGTACARAHVLARAWDRMSLPFPFSRVVVALGAPLAATTDGEALSRAIVAANARALRALNE